MHWVHRFDVIVVGGGHAGAEAAWAASGLGARTLLVTMDPSRIGAMSCNPAIGGLAKGQMVREIDALGGLMGLATDATGIQFRMLNASKGPAVQGPRAQCDKYRYAREVQRLLSTRPNLTIAAGVVERLVVEKGRIAGVTISSRFRVQSSKAGDPDAATTPMGALPTLNIEPGTLNSVGVVASAVVLTTGTFMRGLMHTGPVKTEGGRVGEGSAISISASLRELGFEVGRLKTGTPPRLDAKTIDWARLEPQLGDDPPLPFSDLTGMAGVADLPGVPRLPGVAPIPDRVLSRERFPVLEQRPCHLTQTNALIHDAIRANLDRAPLYNGQIERSSVGPRYCPSIEDKVVRFAQRDMHHIYLEPESLETDEVYCNGISTSLPADVQDVIVHHMPACEKARILRYGYAVEYDMVWPHQIDATTMTKRVEGLFLAGQINGTSGYEEAAGQGLIAGLNAARFVRNQTPIMLRRDQAYIGVLLDDLVTKTPREPYRMFTSRAEHRLLLRADNADERLTPLGRELGLVDESRWTVYEGRMAELRGLRAVMATTRIDGQTMLDWAKRPEVDVAKLAAALFPLSPLGSASGERESSFAARVRGSDASPLAHMVNQPDPSPGQQSCPLSPRSKQRGEGQYDPRLLARLLSDIKYAGYIDRQKRDIDRMRSQEELHLPSTFDFGRVTGLRKEAQNVLAKHRPTTLGQAGRLAGVTPADLMLITVALAR